VLRRLAAGRDGGLHPPPCNRRRCERSGPSPSAGCRQASSCKHTALRSLYICMYIYKCQLEKTTAANCKCKADRDLLLEVSLVALAPVLVDALPPLLRAVPPRRRRRHHLLLLLSVPVPVPDEEVSRAHGAAERRRCCGHAVRRR
jgi:hypothetical protein